MIIFKMKGFYFDFIINSWMNFSIRLRRLVFYEGSLRKRARLEKYEIDIVVVGDEIIVVFGLV